MGVDVMRVLPLDELQESQAIRLVLKGMPIMLVKVNGTPHALVDVCPHNGAALSEGVIRDGCVTCPWHLWRFSVSTGLKQGDDDVAVRVLTTRVTPDEWIEIDVPDPAPVRSMRETLLAHARGELLQ